MLQGETGTGREFLARALQRRSGRSGPFETVKCASLAPDLVESELFGCRKGASEGATEDRPGHLRSAHGGTLFLDDIGELPLHQQAQLLRTLQEKKVVAVGGDKSFAVDFQIITGTRRDLHVQAEAHKFRLDLLCRLRVFTIYLQPLRERLEDLGNLVAGLLRKHARDKAGQVRFSLSAARALVYYGWPFNVGELNRALAEAVALSGSKTIELEHLPEALKQARETAP